MTDAENRPADPAAPPPPPPPPPPASAAAPAPGSPQPDTAVESKDLLQTFDVTGDGLLRAIRSGAVAYAVAWLVGLLSTVLALVLALVQDSGDDISWWWLLTAPGQLVAMAFRSPATFSSSGGDEGMSASASVSATAPLLIVLLVALYATFRLSRRDETASPSASTRGAVSLAVVSAGTFVVIALVLALALRVTLSDDEASTKISAGGFQLVLLGLVATAAAALLGRRPWSSWSVAAALPPAAYGAWRGVVTHVAVFSVLTLVTSAVWLVVRGGTPVLIVLPVAFVNVVVYALTLGHLGALDVGGTGSFLGQSDGSSESLWMFSSGVDHVIWVLPLFALAGTLASAVVMHRWGGAAPRSPAQWAWAAGVYGATGGVLTVLGTASTAIGAGYAVGNSSFGPAPWFFLVLAVWGVLAELGARTVGPALGEALPAAWVARATGDVGVRTVRPTGTATPPATSASATTGPAPAAPARPMDARTKKIVIAAGVGLVAVVVATVGVSVAGKTFFGPDKAVEDYVAALADGRADDALDLVRLDYTASERVLLTDEVLGAGGARIDDVEIGDVRTSGDSAAVRVELTVDGSQQSQDVSLRRSGSRFVVFDEWEIVDVDLGTVDLTVPGATGVEVDGREIDVDGLDDGVTLPMFPGTYDVRPTSGSSYLRYEPKSVTIGTDPQSLRFEAAPTDDLLAEVGRKVEPFLQACMARPEPNPTGCPNDTFGYDLKDVRWTLDTAPTYELRPDYSGGWRFSSAIPGRASVTAKEPSFIEGEPAKAYTDEVPISVSGGAVVDDDTVTVTIDDFF